MNSVKAKVESNLSQLDNLKGPLLVAKQNLLEREETRKYSASYKVPQTSSPKSLKDRAIRRRLSGSSPPRVSTPEVPSPSRNTFVERQNSLVVPMDSSSSEQDLENVIEQSSSWILLNLGPKGISRERTRSKHISMIKNTVYCAVLMEEWMKELAAISLEHAVQPHSIERDVTF